MNTTTPRFPFVDVRTRLRPDRVAHHVAADHRTRQVPQREAIIRETAHWLFRAQDATAGAGVAEFYHLETGWSGPCAETAVAAIPTLLSLDRRYPSGQALARAIRLGVPENVAPLLANRSGPIATCIGRIPTLAQAILAWAALYEHTHDRRFRSAAVDAAHQLIGYQQEALLRHVVTHSHQALSAWAMLRAAVYSPAESLTATASSCAQAVSEAISRDGYLHENFRPEMLAPLLLRVTQTLHALLEAGLLSNTAAWIAAAQRGAQRLFELYSVNSTGAGRLAGGWRGNHAFNCMAGSALTSVLWLRCIQQGSQAPFLNAAAQMNRFLASTVDTANLNPGIRGGIRAGYPLWVDYHPLAYRALAAKFALDAFLLEDELTGAHDIAHKLQFKKPAEREIPASTVGGTG